MMDFAARLVENCVASHGGIASGSSAIFLTEGHWHYTSAFINEADGTQEPVRGVGVELTTIGPTWVGGVDWGATSSAIWSQWVLAIRSTLMAPVWVS